MKNESFDSMDESIRRRLENVPPAAVPPSVLKGFSASVASRLREAEKPAPAAKPFRVPAFAPVFAVLVLAVVAVNRMGPAGRSLPPAPAPAPYVQLASNTSSLSSEIAALRELGVWTEEDERALGVTDDAALEELAYSRLRSSDTSEIV